MRKLVCALALVFLMTSLAAAQDFPRFEMFGGYSLQRTDLAPENIWDFGATPEDLVSAIEDEDVNAGYTTSKYLKGFQGSVTCNINRFLGIEASVRYNKRNVLTLKMNYPDSGSFDTSIKGKMTDFAFLAGPHVTYRRYKNFTMFAHALFGLDSAKTSTDVTVGGSTSLYDAFVGYMDSENDISLPYSDGGAEESDTGFGMAFGGGVDAKVSSFMALRLIQADYFLSKHGEETVKNLGLSFGAVFFIGK